MNALGYVDGELDTVVTESAGCDSAVDGSTAVTTEDAGICQYVWPMQETRGKLT